MELLSLVDEDEVVVVVVVVEPLVKAAVAAVEAEVEAPVPLFANLESPKPREPQWSKRSWLEKSRLVSFQVVEHLWELEYLQVQLQLEIILHSMIAREKINGLIAIRGSILGPQAFCLAVLHSIMNGDGIRVDLFPDMSLFEFWHGW
jgi:hypothetical protein